LPLLVLVLILLITLLRLGWFVFLLVHITHFLTVKNVVTNHSALKIMPAAILERIANGEIEYHIADIRSIF
jgi:DNA-binding transcriptional MocR family regulator